MSGPKLKTVIAPNGAKFTVAEDLADKFEGLIRDLEDAGYPIDPKQSGGYNPRNIAGTNTPSNHAFGRAIDVNWTNNPLGKDGDIPPELARTLSEKYGLRWGGDYKSRKDPMHFEYVGGESPAVQNRSLTSWAGSAPPQPKPDAVQNIFNKRAWGEPDPSTVGPPPPPTSGDGAFMAGIKRSWDQSPAGILASGLQRGDSTDIAAGGKGIASAALGAFGKSMGGDGGAQERAKAISDLRSRASGLTQDGQRSLNEALSSGGLGSDAEARLMAQMQQLRSQRGAFA